MQMQSKQLQIAEAERRVSEGMYRIIFGAQVS